MARNLIGAILIATVTWMKLRIRCLPIRKTVHNIVSLIVVSARNGYLGVRSSYYESVVYLEPSHEGIEI